MPPTTTTAHLAEVLRVEERSPSFRRVVLGGEGMRSFGFEHHPLDQRFKMIIPPQHEKPSLDLVDFLESRAEDDGLSWYQAWLRLEESERGAMRTYTIREWRDEERELVVDMVLHTDEQGVGGPAGTWARDAEPGWQLHVIGPHREGEDRRSGIEFEPRGARDLLLVGDETAVPAIASILDSLAGQDVRGCVILEVPTLEDVPELDAPGGIEVIPLARDGRAHGDLTIPAVKAAVTTHPPAGSGASGSGVDLEEVDIDSTVLWDTPQLLTHAAHGSTTETHRDERPFYAWIAGEAGVVKTLRRYLVREVGVDRKQVAFMGYWRRGKAEG
ncbi:siderophore-interacting protein [Brachybacterium endophyticum]|uniref:siderophore-interacting protein n=1 Tax=Brachybacterium endophyticum TaxID=2182385 RepID=UPI001F0C0CAE|nr:siderophore-interacting protein [Brachybacterium endophyticum]